MKEKRKIRKKSSTVQIALYRFAVIMPITQIEFIMTSVAVESTIYSVVTNLWTSYPNQCSRDRKILRLNAYIQD